MYQGLLNVFWMLPSVLGNALTSLEAKMLRRTSAGYGSSPITSSMNWPYRAAWRELFTFGTLFRMTRFSPPHQVPFLFLFAGDRPESMRFCDARWYEKVASTSPLSESVKVRGNHWFPNQHFDHVLELMQNWLLKTEDFQAKL